MSASSSITCPEVGRIRRSSKRATVDFPEPLSPLAYTMETFSQTYIAIWLIFCGYVLSVARRMASLKDDIRRLKQDGK